MDDKFQFYIPPVTPAAPRSPGKSSAGRKPEGPSFDQVLDGHLRGRQELQFSRHALNRMESRGIRFSGEEMSRIEDAVQAVQSKGGRDSLVLLGENALVVSVKNNTVVTVVDKDSLKGNIFTNIDSAVIA